MIRKLFIFILYFCSVYVFAASDVVSQYAPKPQTNWCYAPTASDPSFCAQFPPVATCNCNLTPGSTPNYCKSMYNIYLGMMTQEHYSSDFLKQSCDSQTITSSVECQADWMCYWYGGNSLVDGSPCNGNGIACTTQQPPKPPHA